jgi:hypothetical protein
MLVRSRAEDRVGLVLCLVFATLGEIFLSLIWGLYEYRLGTIPLFVLPGHCLLYSLGIRVAKRLPSSLVFVVPALTFPYICLAASSGQDTESLLWFVVFLMCLRYGPAKKLYATMFVLALVMEIYGTWLGNWVWAGTVPWLGLTSSNPPACAGVFYCLLDLIVTTLTPRISSQLSRSPAAHSEGFGKLSRAVRPTGAVLAGRAKTPSEPRPGSRSGMRANVWKPRPI